MKAIQKIYIALVILCPLGLFAQTNFFVSQKGNDANKGTLSKPFALIDRALIEVRKSVIGDKTEVIIFRNQKEAKKRVVLK